MTAKPAVSLYGNATYLVLVQKLDSLHQLEHVRLHSLFRDAMWHLLHVMKEGPVHELEHQVQLAIGSEALKEGHQVGMVQASHHIQLPCSSPSDLQNSITLLTRQGEAG